MRTRTRATAQTEPSDDYAYGMSEYGLTAEELKRFERRLKDRAARLDKTKKWKRFSSLEKLKDAVEKEATRLGNQVRSNSI